MPRHIGRRGSPHLSGLGIDNVRRDAAGHHQRGSVRDGTIKVGVTAVKGQGGRKQLTVLLDDGARNTNDPHLPIDPTAIGRKASRASGFLTKTPTFSRISQRTLMYRFNLVWR